MKTRILPVLDVRYTIRMSRDCPVFSSVFTRNIITKLCLKSITSPYFSCIGESKNKGSITSSCIEQNALRSCLKAILHIWVICVSICQLHLWQVQSYQVSQTHYLKQPVSQYTQSRLALEGNHSTEL